MEAKLLSSDEELQRIIPVMQQLRTEFDTDSLLIQIKSQMQEGYRIAYVEQDGEVMCVAGFVIGQKLAWQKHIYIDDLVTARAHRSTGAGHCLMNWLRQYARSRDCQQLHLDSGVLRYDAHKFYLREGFVISSHHFATDELDGNPG